MKLFIFMAASLVSLQQGIAQEYWTVFPKTTYEDVSRLTSIPNGTYKKYISKSGEEFGVGDTIQIGKPAGTNGAFIYVDLPDLAWWSVKKEASVGAWADRKVIIKKIDVWGSKKKGFWAVMHIAGGVDGTKIHIESALEAGELIGKNPTSSQALELLKTAKDKLELGLISQAEYDSIKVELAKFIK